ncbi:MAG: DUF4433 domain-containing protein [Pseudomonadales bacterium]|nr:DUF4433 domain-containing protein [Pseudomonadales bacterium]
MAYNNLNPEKALIWRIIHRDNVAWVLENGLHCGNSAVQSENWVHIGNPELTDKRGRHPVPAGAGGYLNDYVPFYFTPFSVMMRNIQTGWGGIPQRSNDEIVILVSSLPRVIELGLDFVFTDSHAYYQWANFYTDSTDLDKVDWSLLQTRNFTRDADDPAKFERYQAEALVHKHCPVEALLGMVCYTESVQKQLESMILEQGQHVPVHTRKQWYI